jgi:hypothetical protein
MKPHFKLLAMVLALSFGSNALAQVRSVTLGIRTHCPYGIKGCWPEIRDGLERPEAITSINQKPDPRTDTCEVTMRSDWAPDPGLFARNFASMHIGVDVRGVEAVVDGILEDQGTNLVLRVGGSDAVLRLVPLTTKVQWNASRKQNERPARSERKAFARLQTQWDRDSKVKSEPRNLSKIRITGPLIQQAADGSIEPGNLVLEVRKYELQSNR